MQRHRWTRLAFVIAAIAALCTVVGVSAATTPARYNVPSLQPAQAAPTAVAAGTYSGTVTSNTNSGLTIHGNDGDRTVVVQPGAQITRDNKSAAVNDLKNGDNVTMIVAQNGVVQTITATSKKSSGFNPLWLLLLLLLLIPLLLWLMSRKKKDDFVVERNTGTTGTKGDSFTVEKDRDANQRPRM